MEWHGGGERQGVDLELDMAGRADTELRWPAGHVGPYFIFQRLHKEITAKSVQIADFHVQNNLSERN